MNFTPGDEQINVHRRIEAPTISETVSKQTLYRPYSLDRDYETAQEAVSAWNRRETDAN